MIFLFGSTLMLFLGDETITIRDFLNLFISPLDAVNNSTELHTFLIMHVFQSFYFALFVFEDYLIKFDLLLHQKDIVL
jgi:hypothetical protein